MDKYDSCMLNIETSVVAIKEIGPEVNADKTKNMVMSRDQIAGRSRNINIPNKSYKRLKEFIYLGTTLTKQNFIQEEVKSRLQSGNAFYHSVQNLLTSRFYPKRKD
jgi:hypothetical protein